MTNDVQKIESMLENIPDNKTIGTLLETAKRDSYVGDGAKAKKYLLAYRYDLLRENKRFAREIRMCRKK